MAKLTVYEVRNGKTGFERITQEESDKKLAFLKDLKPTIEDAQDTWEALRKTLNQFKTDSLLLISFKFRNKSFEYVYDIKHKKAITGQTKDEVLIKEFTSDPYDDRGCVDSYLEDMKIIAYGYDLSEVTLNSFLKDTSIKFLKTLAEQFHGSIYKNGEECYFEIERPVDAEDNYARMTLYYTGELTADYVYEEYYSSKPNIAATDLEPAEYDDPVDKGGAEIIEMCENPLTFVYLIFIYLMYNKIDEGFAKKSLEEVYSYIDFEVKELPFKEIDTKDWGEDDF